METPQAPQVSISGQIRIEGQLHSSTPNPQQPPPAPPPWWKFWKWRPEPVLAAATIVLAAATFLLAYMAWKQTAILATTDESTRKAAEAAGKSAGAAETALQLTKQEQRPIIWLTDGPDQTPKFVLDKLPADPTSGQILWKWYYTNYGKTPALHVSYRSFIVIENKREESFRQPPEGNSAAPIPPGKHDFSDVISPPGIKPEQFAQLMQTEKAIGIEGKIIYSTQQEASTRPHFA
jgi:hypothetical protein